MVFWEPSWIRIIFTPALSCSGREVGTPTQIPQKDTPWGGWALFFGGVLGVTWSCLMVSPPLPMTRPALPAGIMISCTVPFWPLALSWNCPGGPPRPRETMSSSISFAFLWGGGTRASGGGHARAGLGGTRGTRRGPTHCTASGDPVRETLRSGNPPLSVGRGARREGGAWRGSAAPPCPTAGGKEGIWGDPPRPTAGGRGGGSPLSHVRVGVSPPAPQWGGKVGWAADPPQHIEEGNRGLRYTKIRERWGPQRRGDWEPPPHTAKR